MKIEIKSNIKTKLFKINAGDCFSCYEGVFLRTKAFEFKDNIDTSITKCTTIFPVNDIKEIKCVKLETGEIYSFDPYKDVAALNLKGVEE
jgi:hypothetical protein